jgi:SAM-dependent methyltransferase
MSRARAFFDAIAGRYERDYAPSGETSRARMRRVLAELPAAPARVLDLGVGTGRELSSLLDAGHVPTGVDVSPEMLTRCARRARPVTLVEADFWEPLPFADASFDAAVALHGTLAHPPDEQAIPRLARELARVVRAGGVLVVEVPSPAWLDHSAGDACVRRTGPSTGIYGDSVAGAEIETRLLTDAEWVAALAPWWDARVEASSDVEWLVLARRAG